MPKKKIGIVFSALLGVSLTSGAASPVSVPIRAVDQVPFFLVDVVLDDRISTQMLVDTGASETVLAQWFAQSNKIPGLSAVQEEGRDSGGQTFNATRAKISSYKVGQASHVVSSLFVVPTPPPFQQLSIGGIFSPASFFENQAFLLDFPSGQMIGGATTTEWMKQKTLIEKIKLKPCSTEMNNKYLVQLKVNGHMGWFYLDTGGVRSAVTREFAARAGNLRGKRAERVGLGSRRGVERVEGVAVEFGKIKQSLTVDVEPEGVSCPAAQGKLGNDFLRKYALLFSADRKELSLFR